MSLLISYFVSYGKIDFAKQAKVLFVRQAKVLFVREVVNICIIEINEPGMVPVAVRAFFACVLIWF